MNENSFQLRMEKGLPPEAEPIAPIAPLDAPMPEFTDTAAPEPEPTQTEVAYAAPQPEPVAQPEPDREKNLRILRERSERAERERDEAVKVIRDMAARMNQPQQVQDESEEEETVFISDDALVEGKHLAAYEKKLKKLEAQIHNYQNINNSVNVETRLKNQYPDFDRIVSKDNVEILKSEYPELATSLSSNPDLYSKAVSTYTLLKKLGIATDDATLIDRERAIKNAAKPRPLVSVSPQQGDSPLARANAFAEGLTPELQKQLIKEMAAARRSL